MTDNKNEKPRTTKKRPGETGAEDNKNLRTKRFEMRLTPEEWNSLSLRSKEAGYSSTSLYARAILLPEHNQRHQEFKKETQLRVQLLASLGKIGSNINQIAHALNRLQTWNETSRGMYTELIKLQEALTTITKLFKSKKS